MSGEICSQKSSLSTNIILVPEPILIFKKSVDFKVDQEIDEKHDLTRD